MMTEMGHICISVDSPGRDKRTDINSTPLPLFDQKLGIGK